MRERIDISKYFWIYLFKFSLDNILFLFFEFSKWIAHLRVEEAKQLMTAHPDYSNEAVAKECGFSSRSYFQKVFRDLTGMTPREFQSQCNKNATP